MPTELHARSISATVSRWLAELTGEARVLATFARVCNVELTLRSGSEILALVTEDIGDGPLNAVLADSIDWQSIAPRTPVVCTQESIHIGSIKITLHGAMPWNPRPDWKALRIASSQRLPHLESVTALAHRYGPADSWLAMLTPAGQSEDPVIQTARAGLPSLQKGLQQPQSLHVAATQLAGLGAGLTPAGDDFLAGAMLALWQNHTAPAPLCEIIATTAAPRTTLLAAAMLRRAAVGECSAAWHNFLQALAVVSRSMRVEENILRLEAAVRNVLAYGHSSGGDTLAGFLWMHRALIEGEDKAAL